MTGSSYKIGPMVALLAFLAVAFLSVTEFLCLPWTVAGRSMEPGLRVGDRVIVDRWTYRHRAPRPGEIVLFDGPGERPIPMVKRASRAPYAEREVPRAGRWPSGAGERGVWVLGDDRPRSRDSREFGAVPLERIRGRVVYRYWPPSRAGAVPAPPPR